ncbi:MAG: hypothetical protein J0M01_07570 [Dechloromonas sp.]|jgi:hypothetical protein|nr:hypothetical protein [Dechloromonas sp.]
MRGRHTVVFRTRPERVGGIAVGGQDHQILLALRGCGGMTSDQIFVRFAHPSTALCRLARAGLIVRPERGHKGETVRLTEAGRELVRPGGPLSRSKSLITYCQL